MEKRIKIPKYIVKELEKASYYAKKSSACIEKFEDWVRYNVDENFDFETLRLTASNGYTYDSRYETEALTEVEYGCEVDVESIERTLNYFGNRKCNDD